MFRSHISVASDERQKSSMYWRKSDGNAEDEEDERQKNGRAKEGKKERLVMLQKSNGREMEKRWEWTIVK